MLLRTIAPLTLALVALAPPGFAQSSAPATRVGSGDGRALLTRIHQAASRRNYQGTFVVTGGGSVASARIAHFSDGGAQFERIESLDGRQRKVFRRNDTVHTIWPASHVAMVEQRGLLSSFPALLQGAGESIGEWYDVRIEGAERIAGREAEVLSVEPRDRWRHGYRLWADRDTFLLLRSDTLGRHGEVLETSAFSDVAIGVRPQPETVVQPMKHLDGYRIVRPVLAPARLEDEGWSLRAPVPGFRLVDCVSRRMDAPGEAPAEPAGAPVLQAIYADGLTYVSVFIEPYRAERHGQPLLATLGATLTLTQRLGDSWITVVGDVPIATLKHFAGALERHKP